MKEKDDNTALVEGIEKKEYLHILWQMFKDLYEIRNESYNYEMDRDQINELIKSIRILNLKQIREIKIGVNSNGFLRNKLTNPDFFTEANGEVISIILDEIKALTPETNEQGMTREILQEHYKTGGGGNE
jgi:hypothetical protein